MYKWFLAWRYLHTKLIAFFGVASVMLCVAMVLVVMSVMGGFLDTIRARSRGLHSEIVLDSGSLQGFPYYDEFSTFLVERHPEVVATSTPALYSYGIFRVPSSKWTKPSRIIGIRLGEYVKVNDFGDGLHYEKYFPGTTHLGEQKLTVLGLGDNGRRMIVPPDMAEANQRWRDAGPDPVEVSEFDQARFGLALKPSFTPPTASRWCFQVQDGEPALEGPDFPGVIIGSDLINTRREDGHFDRHYVRGTPVSLTVMPLTETGNMTGSAPVLIPGRYVDDSRTGIYEIDSMCVYVDFDILQFKLDMDRRVEDDGSIRPSRTSQLLVGLKPGVDLYEGRSVVEMAWTEFMYRVAPLADDNAMRQLMRVDVLTWEEIQRELIAAVEKEKVLVTILFALISVVAIVLLGCIFYMIVEKKTRDIGVLKALGASSLGVAGLFVAYAAAVGVVGSMLGTLLGSVFVWNINTIQDWLAAMNPALRVWSAQVYSFDRIPEMVKGQDAFWIALVAVVSSILGSLIPAALAGRVWPVRALRYE